MLIDALSKIVYAKATMTHHSGTCLLIRLHVSDKSTCPLNRIFEIRRRRSDRSRAIECSGWCENVSCTLQLHKPVSRHTLNNWSLLGFTTYNKLFCGCRMERKLKIPCVCYILSPLNTFWVNILGKRQYCGTKESNMTERKVEMLNPSDLFLL